MRGAEYAYIVVLFVGVTIGYACATIFPEDFGRQGVHDPLFVHTASLILAMACTLSPAYLILRSITRHRRG